MTGLLEHLNRRIALEGAMTVGEYMEECLSNPKHGYYMGKDPFGRGGDFITAPEISQMFGELVGLWCAIEWLAMDQPKPVNLVELGPGRGTLMADALRVAKGVPGFSEAIRLHLVETSPVLREAQRQQLSGYNPEWHNHINEVPDGITLIVANEFFDALPIRQFQRGDDGWCERLIGLEPADGSLKFGLSAPQLVNPLVSQSLNIAEPGSIVEVSPVSLNYMRSISERLGIGRGAALIIDYGHIKSGVGDTLQAVKGHAYADVLLDPGEADLTAHVDFAALAEIAQDAGAKTYGPLTQGDFLRALGIEERAERLVAGATPDQAAMVRAGYERLIHRDGMGDLFKVLAVTCPDLEPPVGFVD